MNTRTVPVEPTDDDLMGRIINECDTLDITRVSKLQGGKWRATTIFDGDEALLRTFKKVMLAATPAQEPADHLADPDSRERMVKCASCEQSMIQVQNAEARKANAFELFHRYYLQCRALGKGIKRLHRKIARLERRGELADAAPDSQERAANTRTVQSEPLRCNLTGMNGCAYPNNAAPEQSERVSFTSPSQEGCAVGTAPVVAPTTRMAVENAISAAKNKEGTWTSIAAGQEQDEAEENMAAIAIIKKSQSVPAAAPVTVGSITGTTTFRGALTSGFTVSSGFATNMCNSEADRLLLSRGGIACGLPEGHAGRHSWEYSFEELQCEPIPAAPSTLPLSAEQISDIEGTLVDTNGDDKYSPAVCNKVIALCDQALRAIELEQQLAGKDKELEWFKDKHAKALTHAFNLGNQFEELEKQYHSTQQSLKSMHECAEKAEAELAAAQSALADSIRDHDADSRRWAEVLRAQEGLTRIAEKERDAAQAALSDMRITAKNLGVQLARYEAAGRELPEEDTRWGISTYVDKYHNKTEIKMVPKEYAIKLRDYAISQQVRADENEPDAKLWRDFIKQVDAAKAAGYAGTSVVIPNASDAAIKEQT